MQNRSEQQERKSAHENIAPHNPEADPGRTVKNYRRTIIFLSAVLCLMSGQSDDAVCLKTPGGKTSGKEIRGIDMDQPVIGMCNI